MNIEGTVSAGIFFHKDDIKSVCGRWVDLNTFAKDRTRRKKRINIGFSYLSAEYWYRSLRVYRVAKKGRWISWRYASDIRPVTLKPVKTRTVKGIKSADPGRTWLLRRGRVVELRGHGGTGAGLRVGRLRVMSWAVYYDKHHGGGVFNGRVVRWTTFGNRGVKRCRVVQIKAPH